MHLLVRATAAAVTPAAALALLLSSAPAADDAAGPNVVSAAVRGAPAGAGLTVALHADVTVPGRSGTTVPAGSRVTLTVRVPGAMKARRLALQAGPRRWVTVDSARSNRRGIATFTLPTADPARATYRVSMPAGRGVRAQVSRAVVLVVAPPPSVLEEEVAAPVPATEGPADAYALFDTGRTGSVFRWNPCAPVRYRVRLDGSPQGVEADVTAAIGQLSAATGLTFDYLGSTTYAGSVADPTQAGWPSDTDLVITVAGEADSPDLSGSTVGYASLLRSSWSGPDARIARAEVVLEREFLALASPMFANRVRELVLHELGHAVGLAHTSDPTQVMYPSLGDRAQPAYQNGDLAGLARVGASQGCLA